MTRYLVTPALPYANGPIHIGHMVEHIQVNVYVRALRMAGHEVLSICGADSHGTPIELNAMKSGKKPAAFAAEWQQSHAESLEKFSITYDNGYGSTHTPQNEKHAQTIFAALKEAGHINTKKVAQFFDPQEKRFLPDRMVKGQCPKCEALDQYGDCCEVCGATYRPVELKDPKSAISGVTPIMKESLHYFFDLGAYAERLKTYLSKNEVINPDTRHYLDRWFEDGLRDWDISRDGPYFGFKIPGEEDKYFYVWLDAPIGYVSLAEMAAEKMGQSVWDYWKSDDTRIVHFIGKDIVYFHTLFWPAMLMAADYTLPSTIAVHGMLTVDGEKMSKSRGTFIMADTFAEYLDTQTLRYYIACKLADNAKDIDLNLEDFVFRVNADLVNKVVNLTSRTVPMLHRNFDGVLGPLDPTANDMIKRVTVIGEKIQDLYISRNYAQAVKEIVAMADEANKYLQDAAPWKTVKENKELGHQQLSTALHVGKACLALLKPILPQVASQTENMLGMPENGFTFGNALDILPTGTKIGQYPRLFERIDPKKVQKMVAASAQKKKAASQAKKEDTNESTLTSEIDFKTFMQTDLRAAKVLVVEDVPKADKLYRLELDVGSLGKRQVFAGLKNFVSKEDLKDKMVVLVANLKPRKMRFGLSEGMVLAAGDDSPVVLDAGSAKPGDKIS